MLALVLGLRASLPQRETLITVTVAVIAFCTTLVRRLGQIEPQAKGTLDASTTGCASSDASL